MEWGFLPVALAGALAAILVSAGIEDARRREIANAKNAAIALLAPWWWWACGYRLWPDVPAQVALALGVFALFCVAFQRGWMGGGDVKLIGALALWLPLAPLTWMLMAMSLGGGAITAVMLAEQRLRGRAPGSPIEVPYGVAIAMAALLSLPRTLS